jgi:hypothetical protein
VAKIDQRAMPALDRIAETNEVNTAQMMSQLFADISDAVQFLDSVQGGAWTTVEDWFANLIIERCAQATPETLRAMARIWEHAAELKMQKGEES